jgi:enamine deaminase RidA (YjgF/YER057c/UK114 family)
MYDDIEYIRPADCFKGNVPLSLATRTGKSIHVSGIPAFDAAGRLAKGDFSAQMNQVMANIGAILGSAGCGWERVVRTRVFLTRPSDLAEMNRIYAARFEAERYPARTTLFVSGLPQPDFLVEMECEAVLP